MTPATNLSPVLLTLMNIDSWISPQIFKKHFKRPRAWGTLIPEKNLKSKILWKIPSKSCLVLFTHKRSSMWTALLLYSICGFLGMGVEGLNCKRPIPICRFFCKIDLLTDIAALCLTDCTDWRYIYSFGWHFRPSLWTVAPMDEGTILVHCCPHPALWPPPPLTPFPNQMYTVYTDSECLRGGGGEWCCVDHILQEF